MKIGYQLVRAALTSRGRTPWIQKRYSLQFAYQKKSAKPTVKSNYTFPSMRGEREGLKTIMMTWLLTPTLEFTTSALWYCAQLRKSMFCVTRTLSLIAIVLVRKCLISSIMMVHTKMIKFATPFQLCFCQRFPKHSRRLHPSLQDGNKKKLAVISVMTLQNFITHFEKACKPWNFSTGIMKRNFIILRPIFSFMPSAELTLTIKSIILTTRITIRHWGSSKIIFEVALILK